MPIVPLLWIAGGVIVGAIGQKSLSDLFGGAPTPFSAGGLAVWGLAGLGAFAIVSKVVK